MPVNWKEAQRSCTNRTMGRNDGESAYSPCRIADTLAARHIHGKSGSESVGIVDDAGNPQRP